MDDVKALERLLRGMLGTGPNVWTERGIGADGTDYAGVLRRAIATLAAPQPQSPAEERCALCAGPVVDIEPCEACAIQGRAVCGGCRFALSVTVGAAPRPSGEPDGSVRVRVAPPYLEQMRGEGLVGPFSRIRLVEDGGEPRLELTVDPTPTPDTVEWWRSVAQELATEIHKLKGLASIEGDTK